VDPRAGVDDVEKILDATGNRTPIHLLSSLYLVAVIDYVNQAHTGCQKFYENCRRR
jgi:hypothetical protein